MSYEKCEMKGTTNEMGGDGERDYCSVKASDGRHLRSASERASIFIHYPRHLIKHNEYRIVKHIHIIYTLIHHHHNLIISRPIPLRQRFLAMLRQQPLSYGYTYAHC